MSQFSGWFQRSAERVPTMMTIRTFTTGAALAILLPRLLAASGTNSIPTEFNYRTTRVGDKSAAIKERLRLEMRTADGVTTSIYLSQRERGTEFVVIRTTADGSLLAATKTVRNSQDHETLRAKIWEDEREIHVERMRRLNHKKVRSREITDSEPVVDAALLFWLRGFPFGTDEVQEILMVAFSQHFVTMHVRQVGQERISVPAGDFDCFKIEAVVDLIVTEIKTTFWLSRQEPHFLVKYEGRRGILIAPTYTTSLISMK